jgi:hypothetical protein
MKASLDLDTGAYVMAPIIGCDHNRFHFGLSESGKGKVSRRAEKARN